MPFRAGPPRHSIPRTLLLHVLGSLVLGVFIERPVADYLAVHAGVPEALTRAVVYLCIISIVLVGVLVELMRGSGSVSWRVFVIVCVVFFSVTLTLYHARRDDVRAALNKPVALMEFAQQNQNLDQALEHIAAYRRSCDARFRNKDSVCDLRYDYYVSGRTAVLKQSGRIRYDSRNHDRSDNMFYYVLSTDSESVELDTLVSGSPKGFRLTNLDTQQACAVDFGGVVSTAPLTLVLGASSLLPPYAKNQSSDVRYEAQLCWPNALWRERDLLIVDPSQFESVNGNVRVRFHYLNAEVRRITMFSVDLDEPQLSGGWEGSPEIIEDGESVSGDTRFDRAVTFDVPQEARRMHAARIDRVPKNRS